MSDTGDKLPDIDQREGKSFDLASGATTQVLTLATAVMTVTITVAQSLFGPMSAGTLFWLVLSWAAFLLSIIFGAWTLFALAGTVSEERKPSIYGSPGFPMGAQQVTFVLAMILVGAFGWSYLGTRQPAKTPQVTVIVTPTPAHR